MKEIQEEEGVALFMLKKFAPWFPEREKKEAKIPTIQSLEKGIVPTKTQEWVNKILEHVMKHIQMSILIGQLLEIAPYCKKQIMATLTNQERKL